MFILQIGELSADWTRINCGDQRISADRETNCGLKNSVQIKELCTDWNSICKSKKYSICRSKKKIAYWRSIASADWRIIWRSKNHAQINEIFHLQIDELSRSKNYLQIKKLLLIEEFFANQIIICKLKKYLISKLSAD